MLMEGASIDWSAIYMRTVFDSGPFVAGFTVALFAFSQATTRFFADSFVDRHSPSGVARVLLVMMAVGVLLVFFSPAPFVSMLGFALLGIGTSALFPLAISAAAQRTDRPAAINVAALSQISFVAFLLGPPLLGFVSDHWGIRSAFGIGIPFIVLSLLTAGSLGRRPAAGKPVAPTDEPLEPAPDKILARAAEWKKGVSSSSDGDGLRRCSHGKPRRSRPAPGRSRREEWPLDFPPVRARPAPSAGTAASAFQEC